MHDPLYIYVHGFNSSPDSWKARQLKAALTARGDVDSFACPALSHWPQQAIEQLQTLLAQARQAERPVVLVGSSLGGYYSRYLVERAVAQGESLTAVLINPAVYPYRLLETWLGENRNLYTREHYELTPEHLQQLLALDTGAPAEPERYLLLLQTADETLDYREAEALFSASPRFVQPGGSHGFDRFEALIPAIFAFAEGRIELPEPIPLPASAQ